MKNKILILVLALYSTLSFGQIKDASLFEDHFNYLVVNDLGRNGYYNQKEIAEVMGETAKIVDADFIADLGDTHHFNGIASVNDPLWWSNYESIYKHPELMLEWFPVCGNHEYRGNTQAVLDYSNVSRRWVFKERYYTKVYNKKGISVRMIWLDTTPLMDKYRKASDKYPDAGLQDRDKELKWLDSVLAQAKEKWIIVMGHHPIYAETYKGEDERKDMQRYVDPILRKYKVDMYISGHIHNFQHVRVKGSKIDYITNSAAALSREVNPIEGTVFCSPEPGFSVVSASAKELKLYMINKEGNIINTVTRTK